MSVQFSIIVAVDKDFGIGKSGRIPWQISDDMKHFKAITAATSDPAKRNMVIMGRKTWDSLPEKFRPLPGRVNCVITRNPALRFPEGVGRADSLEAALKLGQENRDVVENIFVIGGAEVYKEALCHKACHRIFLTLIDQSFDCDTFFPRELTGFRLAEKSSGPASSRPNLSFRVYNRV